MACPTSDTSVNHSVIFNSYPTANTISFVTPGLTFHEENDGHFIKSCDTGFYVQSIRKIRK